MASRSEAIRGQDVLLAVRFYDSAGEPADADPLTLTLSIYPPGKDPRDPLTVPADAWVLNASLTAGGAGPYADPLKFVTKEGTGLYSYSFTIPAAAIDGTGFDYWSGTITTQTLNATLEFIILDGPSAKATYLYENNMVFIELASTINDATDHTPLGETYTWYFTTTYNPLYVSARQIRLELGRLIQDVPDDTINLAIFEASLEADALVFGLLNGLSIVNQNFFEFARRRYVICAAEFILLTAVSGGGGSGSGGKSKSLADLRVSYDGSGSVSEDKLGELLACKAKWEVALTSAGDLAPGTSLRPSMTIKGRLDPDRPAIGRGWQSTATCGTVDSQTPAANTETLQRGYRRWKRNYISNRWTSRFK